MRIGRWDRRRGPSAGRVLAVLSTVPALALAGWLLVALPLLLLGWFRPAVALPLGLTAAVLLCRYGSRRLPATAGASARQTGGVVAVALASGIFNGLLGSEQLIVRRDPATYAQYAVWLARHGSLPIPYQEAAFGGADPALRFGSMGFYDFGGAVVPQFMPGPPMIQAVGYWLGGVPGLLLVPALLGAAAVLVLAGLVARLVGARWAPLAALAFAVSLPILYTSRATFSEIPSLILLFGGLALLHDARFGPRSDGAVAALAGLVFGLAVLVRIDGLRDVLPILAYAGLLIALRRIGDRTKGGLGVPLLCGLAVGAGLGLVAAYLLARPYLNYLSGSLRPLLAVCGAVLLLTLAAAALAPRLASPLRRLAGIRRLPDLAAGLVVVVMAAFAVRPWLQTVIRWPLTPDDRLTYGFIERTQRANGLPMDGSRLYYEESLHWVIWYVGAPAVVLATLAAALLTRGLVRGREPGWLPPLAVVGWTTVATLYLPSITPDQPWASRRLVPVVIPGLILLAVWGVRWLRDRARGMGYGRSVQNGVAVAGALLLLVPPVVTSGGTAFTPVERGERAAVEAMCAALPARASVLIVERVTGDRLTPVVRNTCDVPTARVVLRQGTDIPGSADVTRLIRRVRAAGRVPVLLAVRADQLALYGEPVQVMRLRTRQDERSLVDAPNGTWSMAVDTWMAVP
ncbi:hypothetical protein [Streptosporangium sp. NPDC006007]|uniref:hypothetical protein n=1 Tax=Streptosporangium sp. NPDC006007 TaxID=3154575 RepID=UPI0033AB9E7F